MSAPRRYALAIAAMLAVAGDARLAIAGEQTPRGSFLDRLWTETVAALARAEARRPHPPSPVKVRYGPVPIAPADPALGPALDVAVVPGHLAILYAHTLHIAGGGDGERALVLTTPARVSPRDPLGAVSVWRDGEGYQIAARSSAHGSQIAGPLVAPAEQPTAAGYPVCPHASATLSPGRNYFATTSVPVPGKATALYNIECHDFVDSAGWPATAIGAVSVEGTLALRVTRVCPEGARACTAGVLWETEIDDVGDAFALTDINRDGHIDVVASSTVAPGEPDEARVLVRGDDGFEVAFSHTFEGGITAMDAGDFDNDGDEDVVVATRRDLWWLNQP